MELESTAVEGGEPSSTAEESPRVNDTTKRASPTQSDVSSTTAARLSAREARVRRRQQAPKVVAARKGTSNKSKKLSGAAKQAVKRKKEKEEDCVKIKFLTGTLYLYRGERRRAEFVRRV